MSGHVEDHLILSLTEHQVPAVPAVGHLENVSVTPDVVPRLLDTEVEVPVVITVELSH